MAIKAADVRQTATRLRIEIEGLRDAYWGQIDRTDNESLNAAMNVAKRLNEAVAEVDATLHSVDLAVDLIEEDLARKGGPSELIDDIDEDVDDESEESGEISAAEDEDSAAAFEAEANADPDDAETPYKPRVVQYTQKRIRDGHSTLPENEWLSLDHDFSYSKPIKLQLGTYEWDALRSWKGTYMRSLRALAKDYPEAFAELPNKRLIRHRRVLFANSGEAMKSPQRIGSLYIETNLSALNVAKLLAALQGHFGLEGEAQVMIRHVKTAAE